MTDDCFIDLLPQRTTVGNCAGLYDPFWPLCQPGYTRTARFILTNQ